MSGEHLPSYSAEWVSNPRTGKARRTTIQIRTGTVVKAVVVGYLTISFLQVLDKQLARTFGPKVDGLSQRLRENSEIWKEATGDAL
jgi:hypothetical protein